MDANIKNYNGTPTLFLNDRPAFYGLMWGSAPTPEKYVLQECARLYAEAGVHFFTFDIGTYGSPPEWCGPREGKPEAYDFSTIKQRFQYLIDADPLARFHLRIHLEMPEWWQVIYPDECEFLSNGKRMCQSYASSIWREQTKEFLNALVAFFKQSDLFDRVVAYQCGTGTSGEWVKGHGAMGLTCGDYSQPMQRYFQEWLRKYYQQDIEKLRLSWADPLVSFETAEVPPPEMQFSTTQFTFRDPRREQRVIDYYRSFAELCADVLIDFCQTIKTVTGGKVLAGAFYGYLMELAWNAGFFGEGIDSEYSTYQRSGHLGLWKVLQAEAIDFLVSPYSYGFRGIGGHGPAMPPAESVRIHNKLYLYEEDSRTHLTIHDHPNFGKTDTLAESISVLQRNFSYVITHGQGIWWLAGGGPQAPHIELSQQPAFRPMISQFMKIGDFSLELDRTPSAEIALLLDDDSFYYEGIKNGLDLPLIFQQKLWGIPRLGAPVDIYLLNDFLDGNLKEYPLYVVLNAFQLNQTRREKLKIQIQRGGKTVLWIYAPGYIKEDCSINHMTDLTGITFGSGDHPWGPLIHLTDLNHPITQNLSQDLFWGTNNLLGPIFHVADHGATTLGNVVYSQGRCRPGFVVKEFPNWRSIYSAAPNLPAPILRGIARYAGVHLYSEAGDVLYATPQLLAVHSAVGGSRSFILPEPAEVIINLFTNHIEAENTNLFQTILKQPDTALFYTGPKKYLDRYVSHQ